MLTADVSRAQREMSEGRMGEKHMRLNVSFNAQLGFNPRSDWMFCRDTFQELGMKMGFDEMLHTNCGGVC